MPNLRQLPIRWILVLLIAVPFGVHRIRLALRSTEETVRDRIEFLMDALEERQPKRIVRSLPDDFVDETANYTRQDVVDAARSILLPGNRFRATVDRETGIEFLRVSEDGEKPRSVTVRVRCLIESRLAGDEYVPFWDLAFTADMERRSGAWMVVRTRDVNHDKRPRY